MHGPGSNRQIKTWPWGVRFRLRSASNPGNIGARRRDARDMERKDAPLVAAPGALVIDTSALDRDQAIAAAIEAARTALDAA